ncbi:nucleotidyl transferase AbiEii/AbiGii toxin family protein [Marinobacterium sp. BA1]|uniref:nucleotidyl transferase AbiEii/AbiGii toxin family protein n=1 Tax=Marinobacterium sp. BA1 TaxID=3138931 RepID=UPI0032E5494F
MMLLEQIRSDIIRQDENLLGLDDVVEKEILQHDVLALMYEQGYLQHLVFIGGTALRLCYGSNRLSEDLDFAASSQFSPDDLDGFAESLQHAIEEKYHVSVNVRQAQNKLSDTSVWKITVIKNASRPDIPAKKMHIDITSVCSIDNIPKPITDHHGISSQISGRLINVLSLKEALVDKIIAFAYRSRRIKPRDIWDIAWLKQKGVDISFSLLKKKLSLREKSVSGFCTALKRQVHSLESEEAFLDFTSEMSRFLPKNVKERTLGNDKFWPYVKRTVIDEVDQVTDALSDPLKATKKKNHQMSM